MPHHPPELVALDPDEFHAKYVGWTGDGRQFFLTAAFVPARPGSRGLEFLALYLFDANGHLLRADIEDLGPRESMDHAAREERSQAKLATLGNISYRRIVVALFTLTHDDVEFGLVQREPESPGEPWAVEAQPGNYMAFFEPWDSGEYDT